MKRLSFKGVILGGVVDIVLSSLVSILIMIYAAIRMETWKLPSAQQSHALTDALTNDARLFVIGMVFGSLCSVVGGYVAARIARREALLNGALSAWLCFLLGVYAIFAARDSLPLWVHLFLLPMSPLLGTVGGHLWLRRNGPAARDLGSAASAN